MIFAINHTGNDVVGETGNDSVEQSRVGSSKEDELVEDLYSLINSTSGTYGVYVFELKTGKSFGLNEDLQFPGASTSKIPLILKLYNDLEQGKISRGTLLSYEAIDYEDGTGYIQFEDIGSQWRVEDLAVRMIKESDNVAQNMLLRHIGINNVQSFVSSLGIRDTDIIENVTTPIDMGSLLKIIFESSITDKSSSREILGLMTDTEFENRIPRYLGDVRVAHKIGQWQGAVSDVGIVFLDKQPFIICVYSKDTLNDDEAERTIGAIAKKVYDYEIESVQLFTIMEIQ